MIYVAMQPLLSHYFEYWSSRILWIIVQSYRELLKTDCLKGRSCGKLGGSCGGGGKRGGSWTGNFLCGDCLSNIKVLVSLSIILLLSV
jgi:hypothetical protein